MSPISHGMKFRRTLGVFIDQYHHLSFIRRFVFFAHTERCDKSETPRLIDTSMCKLEKGLAGRHQIFTEFINGKIGRVVSNVNDQTFGTLHFFPDIRQFTSLQRTVVDIGDILVDQFKRRDSSLVFPIDIDFVGGVGL